MRTVWGKRVILLAVVLSIPPSALADEYSPSILAPFGNEFDFQVAGTALYLLGPRSEGYLEKSGGFVNFKNLQTRHKCRGYQGDINRARIEIYINNERSYSEEFRGCGGDSCDHAWGSVRLFPIPDMIEKCRGRSDMQTVTSRVVVKNTCGRHERHTRTGGMTYTARIQCAPSRVRVNPFPIKWRYRCEGPDMYIEGTNLRLVERNTPNDEIYCIYRGR